MSVGSIVALPIVPYIADILGRRTGVMIGCVIMILGVILQSISINLSMFIAARFFIGFGVAIAHGAAPMLVTELVHPQHRAIYTTIYNCTWYWGSIVAAWLTYGKMVYTSSPTAMLTVFRNLPNRRTMVVENPVYRPSSTLSDTDYFHLVCYVIFPIQINSHV